MSFSSGDRKTIKIGQGGFSLIEAMVAIVIFAIGILGAYKMQLHSTESVALGNRVSTSTAWAAYAVEEILGKEYDNFDLRDNGNSNDETISPSNKSGMLGIDDMTSAADGQLYIQPDGSTRPTSSGNDIYSIYWNIVEGGDPTEPGDTRSDEVLIDTKLIRVHVFRNGGIGHGHLYSHDYYKTIYPE